MNDQEIDVPLVSHTDRIVNGEETMAEIKELAKGLLDRIPLLRANVMVIGESLMNQKKAESTVAPLKLSPARPGPVQPC